MAKDEIVLLETHYSLKMNAGELRTLVKAVQCLELYEGQGPDIDKATLSKNEIQWLRKFRSITDEFAKQNLAGAIIDL